MEKNQNNQPTPVEDNWGVYAAGQVVAIDTQDREYEGKKYKVRSIMITDRKTAILYERSDRYGELPEATYGQHIKVRVDRASMNGKQLKIDGQIVERK